MSKTSAPVPTTVLAPGSYGRIARLTGKTPSYVGRVLRGEANPTLDTLRAIARAEGVRTAEVVEYLDALNG